jgi:hemerythrin-like domain-containing protein
MGIIHSALRRDLERTRIVLGGPEPISLERRTALAQHLIWLMHFLHVHHTDEDTGLWPEVRRRDPDAAALIEVMEADHQRIGPGIEAVEAAARAWRNDAGVRGDLGIALAALSRDLLPHLRREEEQMMPVVAAAFTTAEYEQLGQELFVKTKSRTEFIRLGYWTLDGLDDAGREHMLAGVPRPAQVLLDLLFARGHRRRQERLWGGTAAAAVPSLSLAYLDRTAL